jgi:hypothetical protein
MMSKHPNDSDHDPDDSDHTPDGSLDMKNPDRSEEGQRRREHTGGDDPDGQEVAEKLYGGLDDSESNDTDE